MKEANIYSAFVQLEKRIINLERRKGNYEAEVIGMRLQINAFIRIIKFIFPLNWIFAKAYMVEYDKYRKQLQKRHESAMAMQKEAKKIVENKTVKNNKEIIGRNKPCHCGSGKKYKKCCLDKDLNKK